MICKYLSAFLLFFAVLSCKDQNEKQEVDSLKDIKKKELALTKIEKAWVFNAKPLNETSRTTALIWDDWRLFLSELDQKPKKSIGAFQKKSSLLATRVMALQNLIPIEFDKPPIRARIAVLVTKIRMLDLYINLANIQEKEIMVLIPEINIQLQALQNQMEKIVAKNKIPLEEGESDLLRMLDTARAIPSMPSVDPNIPRVE